MRVGLDARLSARGLGIAHVLEGLTRHLVDQVDVVWFGSETSAPPGVADCVSLRGLPYPALDSPLGWHLAKRAKLDVMHFLGNTGWARPGPVPTVLTVHDVIFFSKRPNSTLRQRVGHAYYRRSSLRAARSAAIVVSVSHTSAADVARVLGLPTLPVVIANGVDLQTSAVSRPTSPSYAVAFSARDPRKRVADTIAGWQQVRQEGLDLKLLAGGGLPDGMGNLASDPPPGLQVLPYLPRGEVESLIAGAHALIYPTEDEGFGMPVLEAMALGTPVITGVAPVTREIGGEAVLCIDRADVPGSIADWLRRLAREPDLRERARTAGLRRASQYTWQNAANEYVGLFEQAVASRDV
jgi:glycosyltransferase involved in cell wall biosynthesis